MIVCIAEKPSVARDIYPELEIMEPGKPAHDTAPFRNKTNQ